MVGPGGRGRSLRVSAWAEVLSERPALYQRMRDPDGGRLAWREGQGGACEGG